MKYNISCGKSLDASISLFEECNRRSSQFLENTIETHFPLKTKAIITLCKSQQTYQSIQLGASIKMRLNKKRLVIILISFLSIVLIILIQIDVDHYSRIASTQQYTETIPRLSNGGSHMQLCSSSGVRTPSTVVETGGRSQLSSNNTISMKDSSISS